MRSKQMRSAALDVGRAGRRPARSGAPPRARSGRARASRRRRAARRGCGSRRRPRSSRASCSAFSTSCGALDEDVADRERRLVQRERRVVAAGPHLLGPDPARDVDQQAAAVALAVDVAGTVQHLLEVRQGELARARGSASRPCGPRRRSHTRRGPRRSAARRAGGKPSPVRNASASSGAARNDWGAGQPKPPGFRAFFERARDGDKRVGAVYDSLSAALVGGPTGGLRI